MGRFASDTSVLAVIVTSECPVKNTFIHYSGECDRGSVKRFTTDPSSEPRYLASMTRPSLRESFGKVLPYRCNEGEENAWEWQHELTSSASDASVQDDACSVANTDQSSLCNYDLEASNTNSTWSPTSTPEQSPRCSWAQPVGPVVWVPVAPLLPPHSSLACNDAELQSLAQSRVLEDDRLLFSFMMRRVTRIAWGLEVKRDVINEAWLVSDVTPDGAIEAWNKQIKDGPNAEKTLRIGDFIVSVNDKQDWHGMMREMNGSNTIKLKMLRIKYDDAESLIRESEYDFAHRV
jgi:hypothetical protein